MLLVAKISLKTKFHNQCFSQRRLRTIQVELFANSQRLFACFYKKLQIIYLKGFLIRLCFRLKYFGNFAKEHLNILDRNSGTEDIEEEVRAMQKRYLNH